MKNIIIIFIVIFFVQECIAQKEKVQYHPNYDDKGIHFGFSLGFNTMDFTVLRSGVDSLNADVNILTPGFQVNMISSFRMGKYFDFRFLPGISFGERKLAFFDSTTMVSQMKIPSTYLDFPILLKYKAERINNIRPYLIGGIAVRYDMARNKKFNDEEEIYVRLNPLDLYYEIGFGMDYYLYFFKFSTELKFSVGLRDILVPDPAPDHPQYTNAIEKMYSRLFILSFHFE